MPERVAMTENWSRPWHSLQQALAGEVVAALDNTSQPQADNLASWLTRALGEKRVSTAARQ